MSAIDPSLIDLILTNVADGVFTVDPEFRVTYFNPAAAQITGMDANEAIGRPCFEIFRTPICGQDCPLRQSLRTGRTVKNFEIDILTQAGKRQPISVCTAPLVDRDGRFLGDTAERTSLYVDSPFPEGLLQDGGVHLLLGRRSRKPPSRAVA